MRAVIQTYTVEERIAIGERDIARHKRESRNRALRAKRETFPVDTGTRAPHGDPLVQS